MSTVHSTGILNLPGVRMGFWDYNDTATHTTPISVSADTDTLITNDGLGTFTNKDYRLNGFSDIWDASSNSFNFSQFRLGDVIDIRLDIEVTTDSPNTDVSAFIRLGVGDDQYDLPFLSSRAYKVASSHRVLEYNSVYIGDLNTKDNPGQLYINMDDSGSVKVNGWFCRALLI